MRLNAIHTTVLTLITLMIAPLVHAHTGHAVVTHAAGLVDGFIHPMTGLDHLLVSEEFLKTSGIPIVHVERGGNITFHGPGQLVAYPIVNLKARNIGVVDFVDALEDVMLGTVRTWGIAAERSPANRGIWVGNNKMGSIGLAIRKGISFHGLALNVNIDLTPFSWIQPCGLQGVCMTSMKQELGGELSMDDVCATLKKQFESVLDLNLTAASFSHLQYQLQNSG